MPKRSFAMALAMALFASLAFSAPSKAGTYVTTVTAFLPSKPADDLEVTFTGTNGSISNIQVLGTGAPVGAMNVIMGGNTVEIDFSSPLPTNSGLYFSFDSTSAPTGITNAVWTFKSGAPVKAPAVGFTTAAVPEPASMALLGIGMAGFLSFRRFFKRKAIV
jgi:hypothetical protein